MSFHHVKNELNASRSRLESHRAYVIAKRDQAEGSTKAQLRSCAIHIERAIRALDDALSKVTPR